MSHTVRKKPDNVLCLPTCKCKTHNAIPNVNTRTVIAPNQGRIELMKEYIREVRELSLRMDAIVKLAERACEGCTH